MRRHLSALGGVVFLGLVMVGCAPDDVAGETTTSQPATTSAAESASTTETTSSTTSSTLPTTTPTTETTTAVTSTTAPPPPETSPPSTTTPPPPAGEVVRPVWDEWWDRWLRVANGDAQLEVLSQFAPDVNLQAVRLQIETLNDEGPISLGRSYLAVTENTPDRIVVKDCRVVDPAPFGSVAQSGGLGWEGVFQSTPDAWELVEFTPSALGCIPRPVSEQIISDWLAYWEAVGEFWNPADPDHPLVQQVATGRGLDSLRDLLAQDQESGVYHIVGGKRHPEVISWNGDSARVSDCWEHPGPHVGFFNADGTRLFDPPEEGQRDAYTVDMRREDSTWKVAAISTREETGCKFAPTDLGMPVVPSS